ncbi:MAG: DUF86 domain-containing protein [Anaerolineae bacterium]
MPRDTGYLWDILNACQLILEFVRGMSREEFDQDIRTQDAVVRRIEIIGEAVRRLSEPYRATHPHIAWAEIVGMRNRLIHEYDVIDLDIVWGVVQHDIPVLAAQIEELLKPPEDQE